MSHLEARCRYGGSEYKPVTDLDGKAGMGKMRSRDKTSRLEGDGVEKIE